MATLMRVDALDIVMQYSAKDKEDERRADAVPLLGLMRHIYEKGLLPFCALQTPYLSPEIL